MSNNYKIIEVEVNQDINSKEIQFIRELSLMYSPDITIEPERNKIIVGLRALDLESFKKSIKKYNRRYFIEEDNSPFSKVVKRIEGIGSYGIKGGKRIFVDFNKERKVKNREAKEKKRGIYFYAQNNTFIKNNNLLPQEFLNKIICGDSRDVLKGIPDNSIDLILTSPPYNFGLDYEATDDDKNWSRYFEKLFAVFSECIRVLKYGGRIIINVQPLFSDYIPSHHIISNFFIKNKLIWKGEILWEKSNYNCKYTAWGSWKNNQFGISIYDK